MAILRESCIYDGMISLNHERGHKIVAIISSHYLTISQLTDKIEQ